MNSALPTTPWVMRRLDEVATLMMGQAPPGSAYNFDGDGLPLIAGAGDLGSSTPQPKKWTTVTPRVSEVDDLIVCVRATIGDTNWADQRYCLGRGVAGVRASAEVDRHFLAYWVRACATYLRSKGRGSTFLQISKANLAALPVPAPPLSVQRRLVSVVSESLDRVAEMQRLRGECLAEAAKVEAAVFADFVEQLGGDVPVVQLGDVLTRTQYGTSKKANKDRRGVPCLRMPNIKDGHLDIGDLKHVELTEKELAKWTLEHGDVLINRTNSLELVGKAAMFDLDSGPWVSASYLVRLKVDRAQALPEYVTAVINSRIGRSYVYRTARRAIGMVNINSKEIQAMPIPLPGLEQQRAVIERMAIAHRACVGLQEQLDRTAVDSLPGAILRRAFAGEL